MKNISQNQGIMIAVITGVVSIISALIAVSPDIISSLKKSEPVPAPALPTNTSFVMPTATQERATPQQQATPTEVFTSTPGPTETPTLIPTATEITPPLGCLDRWQVISSNPDLAQAIGSGNCAANSIPKLGISASQNKTSFGINNFREQGLFGIATPILADATVSLKVDLIALSQGEFWIALSNDPQPDSNMLITALQPKNGEVRFYVDQTSSGERYTWVQLTQDTPLANNPPSYTYEMEFRLSGNRVNQRIYFYDLPPQFVNLPRYLFIGYKNSSTLGSLTLQAEISNLVVK